MNKFAMACLCLIMACNSPQTSLAPTHQPHADTAITVALYATNTPEKTLAIDYLYKIVKDTFTLEIDSIKGTYAKKWLKDSFYYAPARIPALDSAGKPRLDSLKKPVYRIVFGTLPKDLIIHDFNKRPK